MPCPGPCNCKSCPWSVAEPLNSSLLTMFVALPAHLLPASGFMPHSPPSVPPSPEALSLPTSTTQKYEFLPLLYNVGRTDADGRTASDQVMGTTETGARDTGAGRPPPLLWVGSILLCGATRRPPPHTHVTYLHLPSRRYMPFSEAVWSGRARASGRR